MTVCIAASCDEYKDGINPKIVLVSDKMLSLGITSTARMKARGFGNNWGVMFAGEDVTFADNVLGEAAKHIQDISKDVGFLEASNAIVKAYQDVRRAQIEQLYLSTFGWNMETFMRQGPDVPTVAHREYLLGEMERFNLGCQFSVAGFPHSTVPCAAIFEVHNPGRSLPQNITGYAAIGSGNAGAISYLARRDQGGHMSCEQTVYNVIAAKRLAEKALGVGRETLVLILERGKPEPTWVSESQVSTITKMWVKEEANVRPPDFEKRVAEILNPPTQLQIPPPQGTE